MTALERAATTVAACLVDAPVDPAFSMADVNGWTEEKAYEIARAVLMAVREPSEEMIKAAEDREEDIVGTYGSADPEGALTSDGAKICFTAMIDAILNEKDTTND